MNTNNQMTVALKEAGVKLPTQQEQLWRIVKDQPGSTYKEIAGRARHLNPSSISSQLNQMVARGMMYTKLCDRTGRKGNTEARRYFTDQDTYASLPFTKKPAVVRDPRPAALTPPPTGYEPIAAKPAHHIDLDSMTVAQARGLYQQLHKMFGG